MLKISLIILAILGVVATIGIAWARHNGYCVGGDFSQHITERVSRTLSLDKEQNGKLQEFADRLRGLRQDWAERRAQRGGEIERLLTAPTLNRERVMDLLAERHEAMAGRKREIVDAFADFTDSLQPEQRARLAELIAERMQHRWGPPRWAY